MTKYFKTIDGYVNASSVLSAHATAISTFVVSVRMGGEIRDETIPQGDPVRDFANYAKDHGWFEPSPREFYNPEAFGGAGITGDERGKRTVQLYLADAALGHNLENYKFTGAAAEKIIAQLEGQ